MLLWSAPCPEGTRIHQKPTASSEGAQLWDEHRLTLSWFREAGPAAHTQSACIRGCVTMARRHSLLYMKKNPQLQINGVADFFVYLLPDVGTLLLVEEELVTLLHVECLIPSINLWESCVNASLSR